MGVRIENECVGCPPNMGCMGSACPYREVPHYFCDECEDDVDPTELYKYDGGEYCKDCLLEIVETVE